jgi:hypothetical protein
LLGDSFETAGSTDTIHSDEDAGSHEGAPLASSSPNWHDSVYLNNSSTTLEFPDKFRSLKICGSPYTPWLGRGAFQYEHTEDVWANTDTDVLMTHGPRRGYRDKNERQLSYGCPHLFRQVWWARPRVVLVGHIHPHTASVGPTYDSATHARDDERMGETIGFRRALRAIASSALGGEGPPIR